MCLNIAATQLTCTVRIIDVQIVWCKASYFSRCTP